LNKYLDENGWYVYGKRRSIGVVYTTK